MGAISSTTETDIDLILQTNLYYSIELWNWCAVNNVQFIYASSAATYGDGSNGFVDQADYNLMSRFLPLNLYGWSKHLFDKHVQFKLSKQRVIPPSWVGLKFFNVYGPNENHKKKQSSVVLQIYESLQM